jgi:lysophospholipid acyltransferase (LPLAT)-like uncharacterized protein
LSPAHRYPLWIGPAAAAGANALRVLGATWSIERLGARPQRPGTPGARPAIFAFWHADLITMMYSERGCGAGVLISRHADGEVAARALHHLGYQTARGSSTRGGGRGVLEALRIASQGASIAVTPDGPRGPAEVVKPGIAYLASRSGLPVVPVAAASRDPIRVRSWDRMRIPRPFARTRVAFGAPIAVARDAGDAALDVARQEIERALRDWTNGLRREMGDAR